MQATAQITILLMTPEKCIHQKAKCIPLHFPGHRIIIRPESKRREPGYTRFTWPASFDPRQILLCVCAQFPSPSPFRAFSQDIKDVSCCCTRKPNEQTSSQGINNRLCTRGLSTGLTTGLCTPARWTRWKVGFLFRNVFYYQTIFQCRKLFLKHLFIYNLPDRSFFSYN